MALTLTVAKSSISTDCATLTIGDTTGTYDAVTNTGGYGAPNEVRANLYLKLIVTLKKSDGDEIVTVDAYNDNTIASWAVTIADDGWYEIYMFGCFAWGAGITYQNDYIAYDAGTDKYYYSIQNANLNNAVSDPLWWTEVATAAQLQAAIDATQPDAYLGSKDIIELCNSYICRAKAHALAGCACSDECSMGEHEKIRYEIEGAEIDEAAGTFALGQKKVEKLNDVCVCINAET